MCESKNIYNKNSGLTFVQHFVTYEIHSSMFQVCRFFCKIADFVKNCRDKLDFILMAKEALTYETLNSPH